MSTVAEAAAALAAAVGTVDGVRVYTDPSTVVAPPGAVIGPPQLDWENAPPCGGPASARFLVYVVVALADRALERLWELVPQVADAIDQNVADAVVRTAAPGVWQELPAYEIAVDFSI